MLPVFVLKADLAMIDVTLHIFPGRALITKQLFIRAHYKIQGRPFLFQSIFFILVPNEHPVDSYT